MPYDDLFLIGSFRPPGGTMCTHFAGTAPEFFLHHAFLDKIWFMWQEQSQKHKNAFFENSTQKLIGFPHAAKEMIDSHNLPGLVKVTYSKFPEPKRIYVRDTGPDPDYVDGRSKQNMKSLSSYFC